MRCRRQVVPLGRDDVSNAPARVWHVTAVARNQVHVDVRDGLPGGRADVHADVEALRSVEAVHHLLRAQKCFVQRGALVGRCVEPVRDMTLGDEQGMAVGHGERVPQAEHQR